MAALTLRVVVAIATCCLAVGLGGCARLSAMRPPAAGPALPSGLDRYICGVSTELAVVVTDQDVLVRGLPQGEERLLRDAGGLTPLQRVYSGPRLRAEFGLGPDGSQALLRMLPAAGVLHCRRG